MSVREGTRLDWWLYRWLCKRRNICPANAHGLLIWRTREDPRIDSLCRGDVARNGACWCGKLGETR